MSGGRRRSTTNSRSSSTQTLNPWTQQQWTQQNDRIRGMLDTQPVGAAYTGPMVAGLSDREARARDLYDTQMGSFNSSFDQARDGINTAGLQADFGSVADQYINPYQSQVIDVLRRNSQEALAENLATARGQALANRAYGGSGFAVTEALANEAASRNLDNQTAQLLYQGYNDARGYYGDDIATRERRANNIAELGAQQHRLNMNDILGLNSLGEVDRGIEQDRLGMDYNEFLRQQEDWYRRLAAEQQMMGMIPMLTNSSGTQSGTTTERSNPGALGVLGAAASIGSMFVPGGQGIGLAGLFSNGMRAMTRPPADQGTFNGLFGVGTEP